MEQAPAMLAAGDMTQPRCRLLVSGLLQVAGTNAPALVQREMPVLSAAGQRLGVVAAVVLDCASQQFTHVLLGQTPPSADYRLIPVEQVTCVDRDAVWVDSAVSSR